ncbi:MAG: gamma subclass chorismate mutase AroQ, partial [Pseudomonadales bacterium]|nr:gamma subclass chorismate mutase AroQ [Pseudomonadales bacterium]
MKKLIATLMLAFLVSALPAVNAAPLHDELRMRKITGLFELIEERLSLMDEVAAYKFRNKLAIEDLDREAVVLDNAARSALRYGFTPESSRFFFAIQIEAAKEIQRYWFQEWSADRPFPADVPSLSEVVRPRLTRLGDAIVENIAATYPIYDRSLASQFVRSVNV